MSDPWARDQLPSREEKSRHSFSPWQLKSDPPVAAADSPSILPHFSAFPADSPDVAATTSRQASGRPDSDSEDEGEAPGSSVLKAPAPAFKRLAAEEKRGALQRHRSRGQIGDVSVLDMLVQSVNAIPAPSVSVAPSESEMKKAAAAAAGATTTTTPLMVHPSRATLLPVHPPPHPAAGTAFDHPRSPPHMTVHPPPVDVQLPPPPPPAARLVPPPPPRTAAPPPPLLPAPSSLDSTSALLQSAPPTDGRRNSGPTSPPADASFRHRHDGRYSMMIQPDALKEEDERSPSVPADPGAGSGAQESRSFKEEKRQHDHGHPHRHRHHHRRHHHRHGHGQARGEGQAESSRHLPHAKHESIAKSTRDSSETDESQPSAPPAGQPSAAATTASTSASGPKTPTKAAAAATAVPRASLALTKTEVFEFPIAASPQELARWATESPGPHTMYVKCHLVRKKAVFGRTTYTLFLEQTGQRMLRARRKLKSREHGITAGQPAVDTGLLRANARKTEFAVSNPTRHIVAEVLYRPAKSVDETRKMHALLTGESGQVPLSSKEPEWCERLQSYVLDFRGRIKLASIKNFQLIRTDEKSEVLMQFGKVDENEFSLDYKFPFTMLQAFGIAVTSFNN